MEYEHISGLKELQEALKLLPQNIARNVLRGAVSAGAALVRDEAKRKAPVYTGTPAMGHPPAGTLKRAIYIKRIAERSSQFKQVFFVGVRRGKKYQKQGKHGTLSQDAYYASWVEYGHYYAPPGKHGFGTRRRAMNAVAFNGGGISGARFIAPNPYMRPAWDSQKRSAVQRIKDYLSARIPAETEKARRS